MKCSPLIARASKGLAGISILVETHVSVVSTDSQAHSIGFARRTPRALDVLSAVGVPLRVPRFRPLPRRFSERRSHLLFGQFDKCFDRHLDCGFGCLDRLRAKTTPARFCRRSLIETLPPRAASRCNCVPGYFIAETICLDVVRQGAEISRGSLDRNCSIPWPSSGPN